MKVLWAPWRMEYIVSAKEKECIFCLKPNEQKDRENLILYRTRKVFVVMNKYPYNNGHLMVVPYQHKSSLSGLDDETLLELMKTVQFATECLVAFHPEGFNIGINIGKAAGAGIEEHIHVHIVPRWGGDTNFMTVTGETRVIPDHIAATYDQLYPIFNKDRK
jgi:ATP adenylyltransferase